MQRFVHAPRSIHAHKDAVANWEWMVQDGLGSLRGGMSNGGSVLESRNYTPYGEPFGATGSSQTSYGFTSELADDNSLLYLRARYYHPALGQFVSQDFLEVLNRYAYNAANPINRVDRDGYQDWCTFSGGVLRPCNAAVAPPVTIVAPPVTWIYVPPTVPPWVPTVYFPVTIVYPPTSAPPRPKPPEPLPPAPTPQPTLGPTLGPTPRPQPTVTAAPTAPTATATAQPSQTATATAAQANAGWCPIATAPTEASREPCNQDEFIDWWGRLPIVLKSRQPGKDWYDYEQRVARNNGTYGNYTRTVSEGPIDADGIEPSICYLVDAKFARNPSRPQYRLDGPPWMEQETEDRATLLDELRRYKSAVDNSRPHGLIIRTNAQASVAFFRQLLAEAGFQVDINGIVEPPIT